MKPFFSIIIPTYNVEKYIARCLNSCVKQSFANIEILVIDDCGNDDSITIAREFTKRDERIKIIKNSQNLGLFASRIQGEKNAHAEYIICLDADDYLSLNACEILHTKITEFSESSPDIVHFKISYECEKDAKFLQKLKHKLRYILPTQFSKKPLFGSQIAHNFFLKSANYPKFTIWDKCYKTELIKRAHAFFENLGELESPLNMAEDCLKFFVISNLARSYVSVDVGLYRYCLQKSSITQAAGASKRINSLLKVKSAMLKIAPKLQNLNGLDSENSNSENAKYAGQIAHKMADNLNALALLETRFDKSDSKNAAHNDNDSLNMALKQRRGGAESRFRFSNFRNFTFTQLGISKIKQICKTTAKNLQIKLFANLHFIAWILESQSDKNLHTPILTKLWKNQGVISKQIFLTFRFSNPTFLSLFFISRSGGVR